MRQTSQGIALKVANTAAFSLMYAVIKLAGAYPVSEVIFFRSFFALIPVFVLSVFIGEPWVAMQTKRPLFHVLRSLAGL